MSESASAFDPELLIGHVKDADYFQVPRFFDFLNCVEVHHGHAYLIIPQPFRLETPIFDGHTGIGVLDKMGLIEQVDFTLTKFMVLEVAAALILAAIFIPLASKAKTGERPQGRLWNLFEAMLLFIRDEVARPAIGRHEADRFLPFVWTIFFFILTCNLLGMVPWAGSPTGALGVTGTLAFITFLVVTGAGMARMGPIGYWIGQVPHMDLPLVMAVFLKPMILGIEVLGLCIKHFVLAVRLLANIFAGHLVLVVLITFISAAWKAPAYLGIWAVTPTTIVGAVALSMLELFVAFLQAYVFAFLASLFIGMAVHPH